MVKIKCKMHGNVKGIPLGFDNRQEGYTWIQFMCKRCLKIKQLKIKVELKDRPNISDI